MCRPCGRPCAALTWPDAVHTFIPTNEPEKHSPPARQNRHPRDERRSSLSFGMKRWGWTIIKAAVISLFVPSVYVYRAESLWDAWALGLIIAAAFGLLAFVQMGLCLVWDVLTFKRGGWSRPAFRSNPFSKSPGPFLNLETGSVALSVFGVVKVISAIAQGAPSLALGVCLLGTGSLLFAWQTMLLRLFKSRFFENELE